jgi:hypothetical protein
MSEPTKVNQKPRYPNNEHVYHEGFYTQEEREHVIVHQELDTGYVFIGKRDLVSDIVFVVEPDYGYGDKPAREKLAHATAKFIAGFMVWEYKRMNGFSGFDCIRWKIIHASILRRAMDDAPEPVNADVYARLLQLTKEPN